MFVHCYNVLFQDIRTALHCVELVVLSCTRCCVVLCIVQFILRLNYSLCLKTPFCVIGALCTELDARQSFSFLLFIFHYFPGILYQVL